MQSNFCSTTCANYFLDYSILSPALCIQLFCMIWLTQYLILNEITIAL